MTNILNRRGFLLLARHCLQFGERQQLPVTLLFIDLNDFKPINDQFGHNEGDKALRQFSELLNSSFRTSDIVARIGGDEFTVLLANHNFESTQHSVARLHQAINKFNAAGNSKFQLSFAYGAVEFNPNKHKNVEALLAEGDAAMYQDKNNIRQI